jgi:hypothetical protein
MKIQRLLGILWLALFSFILAFWLWQFVKNAYQSDLSFHVYISPVFLFGAIASFFLFQGARWARIAIGIIALSLAVLVFWLTLKFGWRWADGSLGVFALASVVLLFFPRHEPVA